MLNSPFLDVPATWAVRTLAPRPFAVLAKNRPLMVLPSDGPSYYQLSTHRSERGEWDFVTDWKPVTGGVVRVEWLAAAQRAIARAHAGLDLDCPILVLCSDKTDPRQAMDRRAVPRRLGAGRRRPRPLVDPAGHAT